MVGMLLAVPVFTAAAEPVFVGAPDDVLVARRAWRAATACAGREGRAAPSVELVRKTNPLDYLGVARTDERGALWRIDLNTDDDRHREVVVHEVTHAWVSEGPVALVEGSAELLADCVVRRDPGLAPLQFDDGRDLAGLPDLVGWHKPDADAPTELHAFRSDAYVGAARLLRTVASVVGPEVLWQGQALSWDDLRARIADQGGPRGAELLAALEGGADTQRAALADGDRDGLTALQERWGGTDDGRFDSDGDGWWDGAEAPRGAFPLPLDGTPVCAPGGLARIGADARGAALPEVLVDGGLARLSALPPAESTGGWWGVAAGAPEASCVGSPRVTVWTDDPALVPLVATVAEATERALVGVESRLGPGPQRVAVVLGGTSRVEGAVVRLGAAELADPDLAGRTAVAARRLWTDGIRDWTAVEAVARAAGPTSR